MDEIAAQDNAMFDAMTNAVALAKEANRTLEEAIDLLKDAWEAIAD